MDIKNYIKREIKKPYYKQILSKVRSVESIPSKNIHNPLVNTKNPKVIVFGQDPYSNGIVEGGKYYDYFDGVAFSSRHTIKTPASLEVLQRSFIMTSKAEKVKNIKISNNLSYLNDRGVILTNIYPTVERNKPLSHPFWFEFSVNLVRFLDNYDILFILLGKQARNLEPYIKKNIVIKDIHPAAIRYKKNSRKFLTCFYETNKKLLNPIKWTL